MGATERGKVDLSILIPFRNCPFIWDTLSALIDNSHGNDVEILVYDDCSDLPLSVRYNAFGNIRVFRGNVHRGVGYGMDYLVEQARGEYIILMGSDVLIKDDFRMDTITEYLSMHPKSIGCSTCLSLDRTHLDPNNPPNDKKRYGAELTPLLVTEDRVDMFTGVWHTEVPKENITEVSSLLGAFYFCTRDWYRHIGGFDFSHRYWGALEGWLSLKSWLCGGTISNLRGLETYHIFSKYETPQNGRSDWKWFNAMFVAYTMMPEDRAKELINRCYSLRIEKELSTHPFNLGKKLIREHWSKVLEIRERNNNRFTRDWQWIVNKFKIETI